MKVLEILNLSKSYNGKNIISQINLSINSGEFVSIIGPSGCGKTTLLHIIAGLISNYSGIVNVIGDNNNFSKKPVVVFQEYNKSLFPWMTVKQNIELVLDKEQSKIEKRKTSIKYLNIVGLLDAKNKFTWELSGGMQQRVSIARALAFQPEILLMDEPFGSLDANITRDLEIEILRIWTEFKKTILWVTHDIDEAVFLSNRVIILKGNPATIVDDIKIELPYPRDQVTSKNLPQFYDYRTKLLKYILKENGTKKA
jgi:NitT/TauT family transport system ATP-binding protein